MQPVLFLKHINTYFLDLTDILKTAFNEKYSVTRDFKKHKMCKVRTVRRVHRVLQEFKRFSIDVHTEIYLLDDQTKGTSVNRPLPSLHEGSF